MLQGNYKNFVIFLKEILNIDYKESLDVNSNCTILFGHEINRFEVLVTVCIRKKFRNIFYLSAKFDLNILFNTEDEDELKNIYDNKFNDLIFLSELFKNNFDKFKKKFIFNYHIFLDYFFWKN